MGALFLSRLTARWLGLDQEKIWNLGIIGALTAVIMPRVFLVFLRWPNFQMNAFWMFGATGFRTRIAVAGGILVAIAAALLYARRSMLPVRDTVDALAPAIAVAAVAFSLSRLFLQFEHPAKWLLGLAIRTLALLLVCFLFWGRTRHAGDGSLQGGEIMGAWLAFVGLLNFLLNSFWTIGGFSVPPDEIDLGIASAMVLAGGLLWLFPPRRSAIQMP